MQRTFLSCLASVAFLACVACHHTKTASGGPPVAGPIPSTHCDGQAPLDPKIAHVPGARASWFNDPTGHERLYVLEAGPPEHPKHQPPLVLIHGVGAIGTADFYPALAKLSQHRHVLAIDLPGFGRSNPEDKDFGPERLARSVDTVVHSCAPGPIDVLGHSSGGSLAVLFAAKRADAVRRLLLVDVAGILRPEVLLHGQLHQTLTPMREKVPHLTKAVESTGSVMIDSIQALVPNAKTMTDSGLLGQSPGVLAAAALLDFDFGPAIAGVRAPTMILWGAEDYVVPTRINRVLHARLERSEITYIPDSGHVPMKDQPDRLAKLVNAYLDGPGLPPLPVLHKKAEHSERDGACDDQEDVTLSGDYDEIIVTNCKRVRLENVSARHVTIRKSDGHLDDCQIGEGLVVDGSYLSVTGGLLRGDVALDSKDSQLDIAGVELVGTTLALRADDKSEIVLSVSKVQSPKTSAFVHQELAHKKPHEL